MNSISILHNSWDSFFRCPFGAVECDKDIHLRIEITANSYVNVVKLVIFDDYNKNYYPMNFEFKENDKTVFNFNLKTPANPSLLFYYFEVWIDNKVLYYGNNSLLSGGKGDLYESSPLPYQITVFEKGYSTPNWFKNSTIYQIFVDRFFNGNADNSILNPKKNTFIYGNWYDKPMYIRNPETNEILRWDFYGGNLNGVLKKLDYLKNLGVNVIYFNPIFEARSNHKYDTGNYKKIDSMFGDESLFKLLVKEASLRGISIILDGVFSHTGSDSLYFNKYNNYDSLGAYQSKDSKYYSWYNFKNYPNEYECWWGVSDLPNVNELNEDYLNYIVRDEDSVINHWMDAGVKGWRLDVADELPDEFIKELKKISSKKNSDSIVIGEVWEDASNKVSYSKRREYFLGKELDSVTNYLMRDCLLNFLWNNINAETLHNKFMSLYENYPHHNFYSLVNLIGSHDVERTYTLLKQIANNYMVNSFNNLDDICFKLLKIVTLIQFTFPGVPLLYYGDEAGLEGLKDPYNRATYPWGFENKKILNWYKNLIHIRNDNKALRTGKWKQMYFSDNVYGYFRYIDNNEDEFNIPCENSLCLILVNKSPTEGCNIKINMDNYKYSNLTNLLDKCDKIAFDNNELNLFIKPLDAKLYIGN
ncbi:alpha-amylase [Clostridium carboxidivorans P7]|uniref:Alpha amylase catalytic region n=1 Tax=Clostridium carboxidivorans P7 TaxID=536227 RepID=C6PR65_9CLOT|nr:glycoside hydrolase family 13 protein [Clostridium carboxidivorans]AKN29535.1 alpha-amylase [Clostridium carboxidivorans P7]EET88289.1 alpha amylase catalytic region [Clostridium carboxidivorans P7]EFG89539.1 alpha amylase, catalytic domain protein [Clostridium carboxidivorans P7]